MKKNKISSPNILIVEFIIFLCKIATSPLRAVAISAYQSDLNKSSKVNPVLQFHALRKYKAYNNYIMRLLNAKGLLLQGKRDSTQMKW